MKRLAKILWYGVCSAGVVAFLYGVWIICRVFLFDQFVIPTDSMRPTLIPGDRVIVDKTLLGARIYRDFNFNPGGGELSCWRTKGTRCLRHNDIAVFNFPQHDGHINFVINHVFCKRCIALPGDTLWSENGYYKNSNYRGVLGIEEEQARFGTTPDSILPPKVINIFPYGDVSCYSIRNLPRIYVPRKGDVIRVTREVAVYYKMLLEWELGKSISWNDGESLAYAGDEPLFRHIFQHSYYFMAGDNILDSNDSRYWGLVPEEYIVGVVTSISYSKDVRTGKLLTERILKKVSSTTDTDNPNY